MLLNSNIGYNSGGNKLVMLLSFSFSSEKANKATREKIETGKQRSKKYCPTFSANKVTDKISRTQKNVINIKQKMQREHLEAS